MDILLITGEWDDVLTVTAANALIAKLSEGGVSTFTRELQILPATFHNYEPLNPEAMRLMKSWARDQFSLSATVDAPIRTTSRITLWIIFAISIFGFILSFFGSLKGSNTFKDPSSAIILEQKVLPTIENPNKFILSKFLLWFIGIPLGGAISFLFFLLPLGIPVFNLIYVAFFVGYGFFSS